MRIIKTGMALAIPVLIVHSICGCHSECTGPQCSSDRAPANRSSFVGWSLGVVSEESAFVFCFFRALTTVDALHLHRPRRFLVAPQHLHHCTMRLQCLHGLHAFL